MPLFRYEHRTEPMLSHVQFLGRLANNLFVAAAFILVVLAAGMLGYRLTEHLSWLDAFLNAAMLLGGMGPVDQMHTDGGKLFAGIYVLVCGLVIVAATGLLLAPVMHRVIHAVHADDDDEMGRNMD